MKKMTNESALKLIKEAVINNASKPGSELAVAFNQISEIVYTTDPDKQYPPVKI